MKNKTLMQYFEWYIEKDGTFWDKFKQAAPTLKLMGFTGVWLPPAYKGIKGPSSEGYDVYDLFDLGEFNQKGSVRSGYGTKKEYLEACREAQKVGLDIIIDVVLNHKGGGDEKEKIKVKEVDPEDRNNFASGVKEIEAATRFTFPGRNGKYSGFIWDHQCFSGIDGDKGNNPDGGKDVIYSIINDAGEDWESDVNTTQKGNFDYLLLCDIETRNPAVKQELKNWIKWYYGTLPFNGVRLDAVKHISYNFFNEWLDFIRREVDKDIYAIGEYWLSDDLPVLLEYIDNTGGRMSLFDAPLHHNFAEASKHKEAYDLRKIFDGSLVSVKPELAVTIADNHDTQPLQSLEEWVEEWFKPHAYALILLREAGLPCVFYIDLYGSCYKDTGKDSEACTVTLNPVKELPTLLSLRNTHAYGEQKDYFEEAGLIGWTRAGLADIEDSGLAVVMSTGRGGSLKMNIGRHHSGKIFYDRMGNSPLKVQVDADGFGTFPVDGAGVTVWVALGNK